MFKKILAFIIVLSTFPFVSVIAQNDLFYYETYEKFVTNDLPEDFEFYAEDVHVTERVPGSEKAVEMKSSDGEVVIERKFATSSEDLNISFCISMPENQADGEISLNNGSDRFITLLSVKESQVYTHDGKKLFGLSKNYKSISIHIDRKNKRYSISADGKNYVSEWYMQTIPDVISGLKMTLISSDDNEFLLGFDNLMVYSGEKLQMPKDIYNEDYIEFVPTDSENAVIKPIVNTNFEQGYGIAGVVVNKSDNNVETISDEENGWLRFTTNTANGCYIDIQQEEFPKNLIVEFDVRASETGVGGGIIARGEKATFNWLVNINENKTISVGSGKVIGKVSPDKWTNVQLILNFRKHIITAYCDGKLIGENIPMQLSTDDIVQRLRVGAFSGIGTLDFDNLLVYQGKSIKIFEEKDPSQRELTFAPDSVAEDLIGKNIAIHVDSGTIYSNGQKQFLDVPAFIEDGYTFVPVRAIGEALGMGVSWVENEKKVIVGEDIEFIAGSNIVKSANKEITIQNHAKIVDGRAFLPLRDLCETLLKKKVFWHDRGLIVISDATIRLTEAQALAVHDYMAYDRPSRDEFKELFNEKNMTGVHPRVLARQEDFDRIKGYLKEGNKTITYLYDSLKTSGEQIMLQKLPERTHDPVRYSLGIAQTAVTTAQTLGMLYKITGDERYAKKLWEHMDVICNSFEDWYQEASYLTTSEMTAAVGIAYDWLYDYWTPEQRADMEKAIKEKSLYYADRTFYGQTGGWQDFTVLANNWNFVCSGGTAMGAVAIYDSDPEFCADIIVNCVRSVERVICNYYPEGAWMEGTGYWHYATTYCSNLMATLESVVGTDFNLSKTKGFSNTGMYSVETEGPNGTIGEHDSGTSKMTPYCNMYLAGKFDDPGLGAFKIHSLKKNNVVPPAVDLIWYKEEFDNPASVLSNDVHYEGLSPKVIMREKWNDDEATFLGYHIDKGSVDHGHIDSGSFVFDMLGVRFATDLGADDYQNPGYFTTDRTKFYRVRPEGHNNLIINPDSDVGQKSTKEINIIKNEFKKNGSFSVADLTAAYAEDVNDYKRGYMLYNDRRNIIIRDEVNLKGKSELYWFMHTKADVKIVDEQTAILTQDGKSVRLDFTTNADEFELSVMNAESLPTSPVPEKQKSTIEYRKIAIKFNATGNVYMNVRVMSCDDPKYNEEIYDKNISEWTVSDEEPIAIPKLSGIYLDGVLLEGFMSDNSNYAVDVIKGKAVPKVTAETEYDATIEIENAENVKEQTKITVFSNDDSSYKKVYLISYNSVVNADGLNKYPVEAISSSYVVKDDYVVENLIDGKQDTWYAAEGAGESVVFDYGTVKTIDVIGFDMLYGLRRKTFFKLEASEDGQNWTEIYDGSNSQKTDNMEYLDVEGTKARFLKLINFGNSEGSKWISLVELEAYGK